MTFDGPLIDAHTHVGRSRGDGPTMTVERRLDWMDERGVDRAVVLPLESPEAADEYVLTSTVLEAAQAHPDRLIPLCSVDPRMRVGGRDGLAEKVGGYVERGARGFGEIKVGLPVDDGRLQRIYDVCAEYDLPALFHVDGNSCTDEIGLPNFERMVRESPGLDFVAHAPGWWSHMAAEVPAFHSYPDAPVEEPGRCDELLAEYDNLYADLSAGSGYNAVTRDPEYGRAFLERHHDSLLFATDSIYPGQQVDQFDLFERFDLDDEHWEQIRHANAEAILR